MGGHLIKCNKLFTIGLVHPPMSSEISVCVLDCTIITSSLCGKPDEPHGVPGSTDYYYFGLGFIFDSLISIPTLVGLQRGVFFGCTSQKAINDLG